MVTTHAINVTETFKIEAVSSADENTSIFDCIGSIDVHAQPVLEGMGSAAHQLNTTILLDFKNVE